MHHKGRRQYNERRRHQAEGPDGRRGRSQHIAHGARNGLFQDLPSKEKEMATHYSTLA